MTKISNQYSLTNILTADLANSRVGVNNASPSYSLDVTGTARVSGSVYLATASGNVGIGTLSPGEELVVYGTASSRPRLIVGPITASTALYTTYNSQDNPSIEVNTSTTNGFAGFTMTNSNNTSGNTLGTITFAAAGTSNGEKRGAIIGSTLEASATSSVSGNLVFYTTTASSVVERMRILANGNIGIRTTTPVGKLHIVTTGNSFTPTETGIIGGNNNYRVHIQSTEPGLMLSSDINGEGSATGTQTYQLGLQIGYITTNDIRNNIYFGGTFLTFVYSANQGTSGSERMRISTNGSIGAPNGTNIYNASDARLKKNISTTTYGLDTISALNPVKFNWVDGFEPTEDGKDMLGFIAQEVQTVIPEAIESFGGNSITIGDTTIDNPLRVNEKFIIPVLVKAIQELSAKVSLLENK